MINEKNVPTDPKKWQKWVGKAKQKFDVYPSAYANGWAAKMYKDDGGKWKNESEEPQKVAVGLPQTKEIPTKLAEKVLEYLQDNGLKHTAYKNEDGEVKVVGLSKEGVKEAIQAVVDEYRKLKEVGLPGGAGVGLGLPSGYINGAPTSDDVNKMKKKLKESDDVYVVYVIDGIKKRKVKETKNKNAAIKAVNTLMKSDIEGAGWMTAKAWEKEPMK